MGNVINFDEKKRETLMYNQLTTLVAKERKKIEEDPWPFIEKLQDKIISLSAKIRKGL